MTETPTVEREKLLPDVGELAAALAAFQAEMPTVSKTKTAKVPTNSGGSYSYTYADLADVSEAVFSLLHKHGLAITFLPGPTGLVGLLLHTSGQRLEAVLPLQGATMQAVGSSLTYGRRYLIGCLTGIVTDDDDDGQAASKPPPRKRSEARPPVAPPPLATPEHPAPDGSIDVPLPEPEPEPELSPGLRKALHAGLNEALPPNLERPDYLEILSAIIGRRVESSKELTRPEAMRALRFCDASREGRAGVTRRDGAWLAVAYDQPPEVSDPP